MNYCMECGKLTDNRMICEDCMVNGSPWLSDKAEKPIEGQICFEELRGEK